MLQKRKAKKNKLSMLAKIKAFVNCPTRLTHLRRINSCALGTPRREGWVWGMNVLWRRMQASE